MKSILNSAAMTALSLVSSLAMAQEAPAPNPIPSPTIAPMIEFLPLNTDQAEVGFEINGTQARWYVVLHSDVGGIRIGKEALHVFEVTANVATTSGTNGGSQIEFMDISVVPVSREVEMIGVFVPTGTEFPSTARVNGAQVRAQYDSLLGMSNVTAYVLGFEAPSFITLGDWTLDMSFATLGLQYAQINNRPELANNGLGVAVANVGGGINWMHDFGDGVKVRWNAIDAGVSAGTKVVQGEIFSKLAVTEGNWTVSAQVGRRTNFATTYDYVRFGYGSAF